jgi:hypothetical protein
VSDTRSVVLIVLFLCADFCDSENLRSDLETRANGERSLNSERSNLLDQMYGYRPPLHTHESPPFPPSTDSLDVPLQWYIGSRIDLTNQRER